MECIMHTCPYEMLPPSVCPKHTPRNTFHLRAAKGKSLPNHAGFYLYIKTRPAIRKK